MHKHLFLIAAAVLPNAAFAQDANRVAQDLKWAAGNQVDAAFVRLIAAQDEGKCAAVPELRDEVYQEIEVPASEGLFTPEQVAEYRKRFREISARPCPTGKTEDLGEPVHSVRNEVQSGSPSLLVGNGVSEANLRRIQRRQAYPEVPLETWRWIERLEAELDEADALAARGDCARAEAMRDGVRGEIMGLRMHAEAPAAPFVSDLDSRLARVAPCTPRSAEPPESALQFVLGVPLGRAALPSPTIGVQRDGAAGVAPEIPVAMAPDRATFYGAEVSVGLGPIAIKGGYLEARASSEYDVAYPAGGGLGAVYGDDVGTTGIFGPANAIGSFDAVLQRWDIQLRATLLDLEHASFFGFGEFEHEVVRLDYELLAAGMSGAFSFNFDQFREQELRTRAFGVGVGGTYDSAAGAPGLGFFASAEGAVRTVERKLVSAETNASNVGAINNNVISFTEDANTIGVRGEVEAGLRYRLASGVSLELAGGYDVATDRAGVRNPRTGDEVLAGERTRLTSETRETYYGVLRARFRF